MKSFLLVLITCVALVLSVNISIGQTFTYQGNCNPLDISNSVCWEITETCQSGNNSLPLTSLVTGPNTCPVTIIITQPVIYNGDLSLGGNFKKLVVSGNGSLSVTGNLIISGEKEIDILLENSAELIVNGELEIKAGKSGSKTVLNIDGDGTGVVSVGELDLAGFAIVNILEGGGLISKSETRYNGNSSEINVYGLFITQALTIQGGRNHKLNAYGNGKIGIEGDVTLAGDAEIAFGGSSEVEIGGALSVRGNAVLEITETSSVKVCKGDLPPVKGESYNGGNQKGVFVEEPSRYEKSCDFVILPVEYVFIEADADIQARSANISWATSKEWENSHFEIERSDNGIDDFKYVGEVPGIGWSDMIVEYSYIDSSLPLKAGLVYYRLKQVDFNGSHTYSKTLMVRVPEMQAGKGSWRAYPNPVAGDVLRISSLNPDELKTNIQVKIISSQSLMSQFIVSNENELNDQVMGAFGRIPQGLFVIELQWNNQVEYLKILKR